MTLDDIIVLLRKVHIHKYKLRKNGWVESACPFARWLHAKGTDLHPSFAISVDKGISTYKCHACGSGGDMLSFIWKLKKVSGGAWEDVANHVMATNVISVENIKSKLERSRCGWDKKGKEITFSSTTEVASSSLGEQVGLFSVAESKEEMASLDLSIFSDEFPELVQDYLVGEGIRSFYEDTYLCRGLDVATIKTWELGWHDRSYRIAIPIRDWKGDLVAVSGRAWPPTRKPKYLHSTGFKKSSYLYGENLVVKGFPAVLVEGQFDAIKLYHLGCRNVFSVLGHDVSYEQVAKLVSWCTSVYLLFDGDKAGREGLKRASSIISPRLMVSSLSCPEDRDPGEFTLQDVRDIFPASVLKI